MGTEDKVRYEVFGDESVNGEIIAYGVVIVPSAVLSDIERRLADVKREAGGLPEYRIHCKELLHSDKRARSDWNTLSSEQSFALLGRVMEVAAESGARGWVGFVDSRLVPDGFIFEDEDKKISVENLNEINRIQFAYWAAIAPVLDMIPHDRTRGWMDPNRNRLRWSNRNRQFRLAQNLFPANHKNLRFEPIAFEGTKPMLLDLADILVHCAARALSDQNPSGKDRYEAVLQKFRPGVSVGLFGPSGGPIMSVRVNTSAVSILRSHLASYAS